MYTQKARRFTDQIEDGHFHHTLIKVRSPVLDNLDCDHLLRLEILAFDNLPKSTLPEDIENKVSILMP